MEETLTKTIEEQKQEHLQIISTEIDQQIEEITRLTCAVFGEQNVEVRRTLDSNRESSRNFREYTVTILFDRIDITNSQGARHTIRYLLVRLYINCTKRIDVNSLGNVISSWTMNMSTRMSGKRLARSTAEQNSGYLHSHLPHSNSPLFSIDFQNFCLGSTDIVTLLGILNEEFNMDTYELLLYTIEAGVGWESLEGVPYAYIRNIDNKDKLYPYQYQQVPTRIIKPSVDYIMDMIYIKLLKSLNADTITQLIEARACTVLPFEVNIDFLEELIIKYVPLTQNLKLLAAPNGPLYKMPDNMEEQPEEESSGPGDEDTFTITNLLETENAPYERNYRFNDKRLKYEVYETRKEREKTRYREVPSRELLLYLAKKLTEEFTQFQQRQAVSGKHKRYKDKPLPSVREFVKAAAVHDTA